MHVFYIRNKKTTNCEFMDRKCKDDASIGYIFRLKCDAEVFYHEFFKDDPNYEVVMGNLKAVTTDK